jgi:hypothetical protein
MPIKWYYRGMKYDLNKQLERELLYKKLFFWHEFWIWGRCAIVIALWCAIVFYLQSKGFIR